MRAVANNKLFYIFLVILFLLVCVLGATAGALGSQLLTPESPISTQEAFYPDVPSPAIPSLTLPSSTNTATPQPTATITPACQRPERVLVIVLDGMRPDALRDTSKAPYILNLALQNGAYTWNGLTVDPSLSIPAHTSLLTGYDVPTHGVDWNLIKKAKNSRLETRSIFQVAKEHQWSTALISGKMRLIFFDQPDTLDISQILERAENLTTADIAFQAIVEKAPRMMVINFGYSDVVGHDQGWMSEPYLEAVAQADLAVRQVFDVLRDLNYLDSTLVVILADHGGKDTIHSNNRPADETIPWIILGPCVKKGFELPSEPRLRIFDTVPTILWALGWEVPDDLDGRVIREAFEERGFSPSLDNASQPSILTPTQSETLH